MAQEYTYGLNMSALVPNFQPESWSVVLGATTVQIAPPDPQRIAIEFWPQSAFAANPYQIGDSIQYANSALYTSPTTYPLRFLWSDFASKCCLGYWANSTAGAVTLVVNVVRYVPSSSRLQSMLGKLCNWKRIKQPRIAVPSSQQSPGSFNRNNWNGSGNST